MGIDAEMFVRNKTILTAQQVRLLAARLAGTFHHENFLIEKDGDSYCGARHCLDIIPIYEQDGPDIIPEPGEQFIRVHLWTRYFGPDYQRGDINFICGVAEWLEYNIPGCAVWYGGDSSGVCAKRFGPKQREAHKALFYETGKTWLGGFGEGATFVCSFCTTMMIQTTFSPEKSRNVFFCKGCGDRKDGFGNKLEETVAK